MSNSATMDRASESHQLRGKSRDSEHHFEAKCERSRIHDQSFEGERPLFGLRNASLENVTFLPGESALKHTKGISIENSVFMGKYPLWHSEGALIQDSTFRPSSRAAIWYTSDLRMNRCVIEAPKMFRRVDGLRISNTRFTLAEETLWDCKNARLSDVDFSVADYVFMNGENIEIIKMHLNGNYSFQDARNVCIRDSVLNSKDAFWGAENVTVYDSVIEGEYLGWHSTNLRLVNCTIRGTQAFCYANDLVLENCRMEDSDLAFEYSTVDADIVSSIVSVKNPKGGIIRARSIGEVIIDEHCINPGSCKIETR